MIFNVFPLQGVNELKFGMTRLEVRNILGQSALSGEFLRTSTSINTTDAFNELGVFVNYDESNCCDSLEFFFPAKVLLNNINLMDLSYTSFINEIQSIDEDLDESDDVGATSFILGIGVFAPDKLESPEDKIESIIVFKKGYYDT